MRDVATLIIFVCFVILSWHHNEVVKENTALKRQAKRYDSINDINTEFMRKNFPDTLWWFKMVK